MATPQNKTQQKVPTRQRVLVAYAEQQRLRTGLSHEEWAERVDYQYCARVAERHRALQAPDLQRVTAGDEWRKLRRAWDQQLRRYAEGSLRFPVELEEAWVYALDEPYRSDCIRELADRYGLWGALRRPATAAGDADAYGATVADFGALARDLGQMLADGRFGAEDAAELPAFREDVARLQADLEALRRQVERAVGGEEPARPFPTSLRVS